MPTRPLRVEAFGKDGKVTDVDPSQLGPTALAELTDGLWVNELITERDGIATLTGTNPFADVGGSSAVALAVLVDQIDPGDDGLRVVLVESNGTPRLGYTGYAAVTGPTLPAGSYLLFQYGDEWLACNQDGESSILRWTGVTGSYTALTGTGAATTAGLTTVDGTGTNFTAAAKVGGYIKVGSSGRFMRVMSIQSDTRLTVETPATFTVAAGDGTWAASSLGHIGLSVPVHTLGTLGTGSASTVVGLATAWATGARLNGRLKVGDVITPDGLVGTSDARNWIREVTAVTSDTQVSVDVWNPGATFFKDTYVAARPMPGRFACDHNRRLWVGGTKWAANRVYYSPVGYRLSQDVNEQDSSSTAYLAIDTTTNGYAARLANYIAVPSDAAPGEVRCLHSTPRGLFVGRSDNCILLYGEPPALGQEKICDWGVLATTACCVADEGVFFASERGIYRWTYSGQPVDLTEGRRNREWRDVVDRVARSTPGHGPGARVYVGVVARHLYVAWRGSAPGGGLDGGCWVCNLETGAWSDFTNLDYVMDLHTARLPGLDDELYCLRDPTIHPEAAGVVDRLSTTVPLTLTLGQTRDPGSLILETGTALAGPVTRDKSVRTVRVGYALEGGNDDTGLEVSARNRAGTYTSEQTLPVTTESLGQGHVHANAGHLGTRTNEFGLRIERTGDVKPTKCVVGDVEMDVRGYRARA